MQGEITRVIDMKATDDQHATESSLATDVVENQEDTISPCVSSQFDAHANVDTLRPFVPDHDRMVLMFKSLRGALSVPTEMYQNVLSSVGF